MIPRPPRSTRNDTLFPNTSLCRSRDWELGIRTSAKPVSRIPDPESPIPAFMLLALNKPFHVLCQFTDRSVPARRTLAEFGLPPGVYPAGRLDHDSEGLLLLTDDGALAHRITDPRHKLRKTYLVQVEGTPRSEERRVGKEGGSTVRSRGSPKH